MSLIFDDFPTREQADQFAARVTAAFGRGVTVHASQEESDQLDPFPFRLVPPIVLVERVFDGNHQEAERAIEGAAFEFGGRFAGT